MVDTAKTRVESGRISGRVLIRHIHIMVDEKLNMLILSDRYCLSCNSRSKRCCLYCGFQVVDLDKVSVCAFINCESCIRTHGCKT